MGFMELEKAYNRVNRETLWQVLRIYDVGGKLLNDINSIFVNNIACVRVKGGESECLRINSGVKQGCIMSPRLFSICIDAVMNGENGDGEEGKHGDRLTSCMQMTWSCVANQRKA